MAKSRRDAGAPAAAEPGASASSREHWRADGQPKTRFPTQAEANRSSLQLRLEAGADLDPYLCRICSGWHLGNRPELTARPPSGSAHRYCTVQTV